MPEPRRPPITGELGVLRWYRVVTEGSPSCCGMSWLHWRVGGREALFQAHDAKRNTRKNIAVWVVEGVYELQ